MPISLIISCLSRNKKGDDDFMDKDSPISLFNEWDYLLFVIKWIYCLCIKYKILEVFKTGSCIAVFEVID